MEIIMFIWTELLFRPLLNVLILLYDTIAFQNLGVAIIELTIIARVLLLPFTGSDEKKKKKKKDVEAQLAQLRRRFANNPEVLRSEQRKLLGETKVRRWPKIILLGVQGLVLLVLYQVFVGGVKLGEIVDQLYYFVEVPVEINTTFLIWDLAERSFLLSFLGGAILLWGILSGFKEQGKKVTRSDLLLVIGFPLFTFAFLVVLPAVKAVFIISTMIFSDIVDLIKHFRKRVKEQEAEITAKAAADAKKKTDGLPTVRERF